MESTTRAKPKILYKGAATGPDFNTLKDVGEVFTTDGLEQAEVLWVDCATTKPDQYGHLLKAALDAGKTLVMDHLDPLAHEAMSRLVGTRLQDHAATLVVSRSPTPSKYALTVLGESPTTSAPQGDAEPSFHGGERARHDWGAILEVHRDHTLISLGDARLIPPQGVMYGIRTHSGISSTQLTPPRWFRRQNSFQRVEHGFNSSFHVYRENGGTNTDYVVIRVQQATFNTGPLMADLAEVRGYWQFELNTECTHNRTATLLGASPMTTSGPNSLTQLSLSLHVKLLQEGSCLPQYWSATYGPVTRPSEGWGVSNLSSTLSGKAAWRHSHLAPWDSIEDPPDDYERWWRSRYEMSGVLGVKVKPLSLHARSSFTVESVAAWRFVASDIQADPQVTFTEKLWQRLIAFTTPYGTVTRTYEHSVRDPEASTHEITLNLPQVTEDVPSQCR
ncbi:hypothetical protein ACN469_05455 [Corallococcus terminator]